MDSGSVPQSHGCLKDGISWEGGVHYGRVAYSGE